MPAIASSAPGKIILFGEHAVVYNRPAIAVPFMGVRAKVTALANPLGPSGQVIIDAPEIKLSTTLDQMVEDDPLALVINGVLEALGIKSLPAVNLRISSTIPPAAGLGSSAAVAVALARAVSTFVGYPLPEETISQIAFRAEQRQHGNPSGIDNTVVTYAHPVYFVRGKGMEFLKPVQAITLVVADTGIISPTGSMISALRLRWQSDQARHETWFDEIASIVDQAKAVMQSGKSEDLGPLMSQNQALLHTLGVSSPELDHLVSAALSAGALGAKLSGGGGGGSMIALVRSGDESEVEAALRAAGAVWTSSTVVPARE